MNTAVMENTTPPTFLVDHVADGDEACSSVNDVDLCLRWSVDVYSEFSRSSFLGVYVELVYNIQAKTLS